MIREYVDDQSRHERSRSRRRWAATASSCRTCTSRTTATSANDVIISQRHAVRRARDDRRPGDHVGLVRGAPVREDRRLRLHRRVLARRQGRAAVREGGGQPDQAVRTEQHRAAAQRLLRGGGARTQAGVPHVLQVGAERVAGASARHGPSSQPFPEVEAFLHFVDDERPREWWCERISASASIGAGALGFHHVRILRDMPGVAFAGFYEANAGARGPGGAELGVPAFPTRRRAARRGGRGDDRRAHAGALRGGQAGAGARQARADREADRHHARPRPTNCWRSPSAPGRSCRSATWSGSIAPIRAALPYVGAPAVHRERPAGAVQSARLRRRRGARPDDPRHRPRAHARGRAA